MIKEARAVELATALFKNGDLSLARSAKLAKMTLSEFITHASRSGIPVISQTDDEVKGDMDTLDQWLKPDLQDDFFDLLGSADVPEDFMLERDNDTPQERDLF